MEREYDNYDIDARELYDFEDFEARDFEYEVLDARAFHHHHHHTPTATVTHTHTHTPLPTTCNKKENQQHEKDAKKAKEAAKKKKIADEKAAKKAKKDADFKAKIAKKYGLIVPTTTTSHSASATSSHATSTTASHSTITPAPTQLKAVAGKISLHTVTHHGTVTVKVTTTAARPQCTKAGGFKKLFRHHRSFDADDVEEMMS